MSTHIERLAYNHNLAFSEDMENLAGEMERPITYNISFTSETPSIYSDTLVFQIIVPIVFSLMILFGVLGNSLVIFVITTCKDLQSAIHWLLLNLAIADIFFLVICGTFTAIHYALIVWPFGDTVCRIIQYLLFVSCYVTVYTLVAVSAVRYIAVVYGLNLAILQNKNYCIITSCLIWITFFVAKIPILIVHGVSTNSLTGRTECIISGRREGQQLFGSFFAFAYVLPLLAIMTLNCSLLFHIRRTRNSMTSQERTHHVTKVVVLVVGVFAICWLPLHIHLLLAYYSKIPETPIYNVLLVLWHCMVYMQCLLNPIVYNACSSEFRNAFRSALLPKKSHPEPVSV